MAYSETMGQSMKPVYQKMRKGGSPQPGPSKAVFTSDLSACCRVLSKTTETENPVLTAGVLKTPSLFSSVLLTLDSFGKCHGKKSIYFVFCFKGVGEGLLKWNKTLARQISE